MICIGCQVDKPETNDYFHASKHYANGLHPRCKECRAEQQRDYRTRNRNTVRRKAKHYKRRPDVVKRDSAFRYNISLQELNELDTGCCHICEAPLEWGAAKRMDKPCIDHCHETNKVRGILCHRCNCAIGLFNDDTNKMQKAIDYLNEI